MAIGEPRALPPQRGAVHRSSTPRLLSVLQRPYWSPPPRSLLPTLVVADRRDDFPRPAIDQDASCSCTTEIFVSSLIFLSLPFLYSLKMPSDHSPSWTRETRQIYKINENVSYAFFVSVDIHSGYDHAKLQKMTTSGHWRSLSLMTGKL